MHSLMGGPVSDLRRRIYIKSSKCVDHKADRRPVPLLSQIRVFQNFHKRPFKHQHKLFIINLIEFFVFSAGLSSALIVEK